MKKYFVQNIDKKKDEIINNLLPPMGANMRTPHIPKPYLFKKKIILPSDASKRNSQRSNALNSAKNSSAREVAFVNQFVKESSHERRDTNGLSSRQSRRTTYRNACRAANGSNILKMCNSNNSASSTKNSNNLKLHQCFL